MTKLALSFQLQQSTLTGRGAFIRWDSWVKLYSLRESLERVAEVDGLFQLSFQIETETAESCFSEMKMLQKLSNRDQYTFGIVILF